jgi:hypothetical protein
LAKNYFRLNLLWRKITLAKSYFGEKLHWPKILWGEIFWPNITLAKSYIGEKTWPKVFGEKCRAKSIIPHQSKLFSNLRYLGIIVQMPKNRKIDFNDHFEFKFKIF